MIEISSLLRHCLLSCCLLRQFLYQLCFTVSSFLFFVLFQITYKQRKTFLKLAPTFYLVVVLFYSFFTDSIKYLLCVNFRLSVDCGFKNFRFTIWVWSSFSSEYSQLSGNLLMFKSSDLTFLTGTNKISLPLLHSKLGLLGLFLFLVFKTLLTTLCYSFTSLIIGVYSPNFSSYTCPELYAHIKYTIRDF